MKSLLLTLAFFLLGIKSYSQSYTFTGNGLWSDSSNWLNNAPPPPELPINATINVSPAVGGVCILNVRQVITPGSTLIVSEGSQFLIQGGILINSSTITLCNQVWMTRNLDVSAYRNGDPIPQVTSSILWRTLTTGAYCYYNFDSANYGAVYGKLYNWYAVIDPRGLAPVGWHVPASAEWTQLANCLGGTWVCGGSLKEAGTNHWAEPNTGATNSSGFTALPGGSINYLGTFQAAPDSSTVFGSATEAISPYVNSRTLLGNDTLFYPSQTVKGGGYYIRCVKD